MKLLFTTAALLAVVIMTGCTCTTTQMRRVSVGGIQLDCDQRGDEFFCEEYQIYNYEPFEVPCQKEPQVKAMAAPVIVPIYRFAVAVAQSMAVDAIKDMIIKQYQARQSTKRPVTVMLKSHGGVK